VELMGVGVVNDIHGFLTPLVGGLFNRVH